MESNKVKKHKVNYSQISNYLLNDKTLSLKAKGLYSFMFSKPDDFNFTIRSMSKQLLEGQRAIMVGLQELRDKGWISYTKHPDGTGEYFLNENPNIENSNMGEPNCQNPNIDNSNLLKEQRINNIDLYNNKDNNNNEVSLFSDLEPKAEIVKKPVTPQKEVMIFFAESFYNNYENLKTTLAKDDAFKKKYAGVDLKHYIEDCLLWSDAKNQKRTERGWLATLRNFMKGDLEKGELKKLEIKKEQGHTNH